MTLEKILEVARTLAQLAQDRLPKGTGPQQIDPDKVGDTRTDRLKHIWWMAGEIEQFVLAGRVDKAMRWLGFVQGVLWADGHTTIETLQRMNMPENATYDAAK